MGSIDTKELIANLMKDAEDNFFQINGFVMNSHQKKELRKKVEKIVSRKLKNKTGFF